MNSSATVAAPQGLTVEEWGVSSGSTGNPSGSGGGMTGSMASGGRSSAWQAQSPQHTASTSTLTQQRTANKAGQRFQTQPKDTGLTITRLLG